MARWRDPTDEQVAGYRAWIGDRPPHVRAVAERFDPWTLYRLKTTGHRVTVVGFDEYEDGRVTLRINVEGRFNVVAFERQVFGIDPDDLVECDLPGPDEPVGSADMTVKEVKAGIARIERSRN